MVKKVVDVPDNADYITAHEQINAGGSFLLQKYNVADLPDAPTVAESAPKKRVIELPAYLIDLLVEHKVQHPDYLISFIKDFDYSLELALREEMGEAFYNDIANWYLGHVEFVPKKEPKFVITVDSPTGIGRAEKDDNGNVRIGYYEFDVATQSFTEAEADELVAGLTALNARKVEVDE